MAIEDSKNRVSVRRLYALLNDRWTKIKTKFATKVDKVPGKGLSTNDFTNDAKNALQNAYTKPAEGIPENDLSEDVQNSLNSADTAMQGIGSSDSSDDLDGTEKLAINVNGKNVVFSTISKLWSFLTTKLAESTTNIGGNAATASAAKADSALAIALAAKQIIANLVTSWQSPPDNTHYPSEKLVKDSIDAIGKGFVEVTTSNTYAEITAIINDGKIPYIKETYTYGYPYHLCLIYSYSTSNPGGSYYYFEQIVDHAIYSKNIKAAGRTPEAWSLLSRSEAPDTRVTATAKTDNANYKILATSSPSPTSGSSMQAVYDVDIALNPSTNTITANISGDAATASSAKSGSTLETVLNQKELGSNKKQSVDPTSETDYVSSKALAEFVSDAVSFNSANYISDNGEPFTSVSALPTDASVSNNDYAFVTGTDEAGNTYYDRYKATVEGSTVTWGKEFRLNNSSFTPAQWNAITSGITAVLVTSYNNHLENTDIHVTADNKSAWNNHVSDSNIHVTSQNKLDWDAKYDKPATGIPNTDLSQDAQDNLSRASSAIIGVESPVSLGGNAAPTKCMVVDAMPAAADRDPTTIYLVKENTNAS